MASRRGFGARSLGRIVVIATVILATSAAVGLALSGDWAVQGASNEVPGATLLNRQAAAQLPMPDGMDSRVIDPATEAPSLTAEQAVAAARENPSQLVGAAPRVQFIAATARDPESPLNGFTGWVVLSTDIPPFIAGPITRPSITVFATYSWVFVATDGSVVAATQNTYLTPESIPLIP